MTAGPPGAAFFGPGGVGLPVWALPGPPRPLTGQSALL